MTLAAVLLTLAGVAMLGFAGLLAIAYRYRDFEDD